MNATVAVFGTLRFPAERIADVLPHLRTLVTATYQNDGCIAYDVAEDSCDSGLIASLSCGQIMPAWSVTLKHRILNLGV